MFRFCFTFFIGSALCNLTWCAVMSDCVFYSLVFPHPSSGPLQEAWELSISAGLTVVEADDEHLECALSRSVLGLSGRWLPIVFWTGLILPWVEPVGDVSSVTASPNDRWFNIESLQKRAVVYASVAFIFLRASSFITPQYKQQFAFYILKTAIHCYDVKVCLCYLFNMIVR